MTILRYMMTAVGMMLTLPLSLPARLELALFGSDFIFNFSAHLLALIPSQPGNFSRVGFYCVTLTKCHPTAIIGFGTYFASHKAVFGARSGTGSYCVLGNVEIGENIRLASRVSVVSGLHEHGSSDHRAEQNPSHVQEKRVKIGDRCWIGEGAIVADHVGADSIVGIGAVVTKPIPEWSLTMGNPARIVRALRKEPDPDKIDSDQEDRSTNTLN